MISANVSNDLRRAIYRREGYACALCGDVRDLVIHHVVPRSSGGANTHHNLICLCRYCHALAHGLDLADTDLTPEWAVQSCVEYVSDMYAGDWCPFIADESLAKEGGG